MQWIQLRSPGKNYPYRGLSSCAIETRSRFIAQHAGAVFEDWVRDVHPGARRYWEAGVELDMVREERSRRADPRLVVSEIKWKVASRAERDRIDANLVQRFAKCQLARRHANVRFEVIDSTDAARLAELET